MVDERGHDDERDRRPFAGRPDDDLFTWDESPRPPRRDDARPLRDGGEPLRDDGEPLPDFAAATRRFAPPGADLDEEWEEWQDPGEGAQAGAPRGAAPTGAPGPEAPAPLPARRRGPRRRRESAGAVLAAILLGFFFAGLLSATAIDTQVRGEPLGTTRTVGLALLKPMTALSGALRLDRPARALDAALGRGEEPHHTLAEVRTEKPKWPRTITHARPLRLYIVGDSMAQVFGSSLENLSEATHLVRAKLDYKVSSGLSRPDFFDWPQRLVDQLVEYDPDATTVLFGANDAQSVLYKGKVLKVGTAAWQDVYATRVGVAMDILTQGGRRVYWVGNPIMRDKLYRDRVSMMDHIYQAEAARHPGVTYIRTWALFTDKKGSYAAYLPDADGNPVLMRASDGIHLTRAGGDRMAAAVLDVIEKDWGMPQAP